MVTSHIAVVIEDDQDIRELIGVILQQSGFEVHVASSGADGVEAVRTFNPAVVTLDLGLPDIDGFEVAQQIRRFSDAYIIMLTGRAGEADTLQALETGADDYLTKPFRPRELRARISAMMRRPRFASSATPEAAPEAEPTVVGGTPQTEAAPAGDAAGVSLAGTVRRDLDGLVFNSGDRTVEVDGAELDLTRTEFDLLDSLVDSGRQVRSKSELVRRLRGEAYDADSYISDADERTIEVHMANLRRKLGDDPRSPRWIKTVRGVGYRLMV